MFPISHIVSNLINYFDDSQEVPVIVTLTFHLPTQQKKYHWILISVPKRFGTTSTVDAFEIRGF